LSLTVVEVGLTTGVQQRVVMSNAYGAANDMAVGPNGTLIVCSGAHGTDPTTVGIRSFHLGTGALLGNYVPAGIANRPISLLFQQSQPVPGVSLFGTASGAADPGLPLTLFPVISDSSGLGTLALPIPPYPQLVGARLFGQFVWLGAPAFSATQGIAMQIMP
jgi:hypothetical protein